MITFSQTCTEQNTQHNNFNWFPQGTEACNPCGCTQGAGREVMMGVGNGVASVIMLTFTKMPGPHADFYKDARLPC